MAQKFNWGAALTTLGRGLGDYAEQQRRERTAALLRQQAEADENRRREQELADRAELFRRQDLLAEQQYGRVMPPSFTLPGGDVTTGGFGGMRFKPATELALDMYPRQKAAPPSITWKDPVTGTNVTTSHEDYLQYTRPAKEQNTDRLMSFTYPTADWVDPAVRGRTVMVPASQYASLTNEFYGRYGGGGAGAGVPSPADIQRRAEQVTEAAVGPSVSRISDGGMIYDESFGGTAVGREDLASLLPPTIRRAVNQAAFDSVATGRYPVTSPTDALVGNIWRDVAPQYAEVAIPPEWTFDPGKPNTTEDDRFVDERRMRRDDKKKPLEFFKEYIVPAANEAKDAGLAWQALVNSAKKYGLDPDDLKPLLDQARFQQFFGAAQRSNIDDKIGKKFGDAGSAR